VQLETVQLHRNVQNSTDALDVPAYDPVLAIRVTHATKRESSMLTTIVFVIAAVLALAALALPGEGGIQSVAVGVACLTGILAAVDAARADRYAWACGLIALAALLNPVMPVAPARGAALALVGISLAIIAGWIFVLYRTIPSQSIAQVLHPPR
jgi:hypothetical protein